VNSSNVDKWTLAESWEDILKVGDYPWDLEASKHPGTGTSTTEVLHMYDYPREGWFDLAYGYSGSERARFVFQQVWDYNSLKDDEDVFWRFAWIMKPLKEDPEFDKRHKYTDWLGAAFYNAPFWLWAKTGEDSLKIETVWSEQLWIGERAGKLYKPRPMEGRELW
jgi:hypothetical protein